MSYTPTEWDSGDIITAEKLNKIEQGISEVSNSGGSGGGSGELPEVTNVDNGDVLTVVDGAWGKAAPISEIAFINLTNDGTGIEASYNDLLALVNANKWVALWVKSSWRSFLYFLTYISSPAAGEYKAAFFNGNNYERQDFVATDADANMVFSS